jgi:hypothetical protein
MTLPSDDLDLAMLHLLFHPAYASLADLVVLVA